MTNKKALSLVSLLLFIVTGISMKLQAGWINQFDQLATGWMPNQTHANTMIFETVANVGSPIVSLLIAMVAIALTWKKFRDQAVLFGLAQFGGAGLVLIFKTLFQRARPVHPILPEHGFSFPSGHVLMATIAVLIIWQWSSNYITDTEQRFAIRLLGLIWIGLVAASRIYLRAHYPSDILGSILLAGFWWPMGQLLTERLTLIQQKEMNKV